MFIVDEVLLDKAAGILSELDSIYWIIGGACAGKSTLCLHLAETRGLQLFDMDQHVFGMYQKLYSSSRHPASHAWFSAANPLEWVLSLSTEAFDVLNRACNVEILDLFSTDAALLCSDAGGGNGQQPLLVDGGLTHPSILVRAVPPERIAGLELEEPDSLDCWEALEPRRMMKETILKLPQGEAAWHRFLEFDRWITRTIADECRQHGIKVFTRNDATPVEALAAKVLEHFGV